MIFQMRDYSFRRTLRQDYFFKRMLRCDYYFKRMLGCVNIVKNKTSFLNIGGFLIFMGFSLFAEAHAVEQQEYQHARSVIDGVISMYRRDVNLGEVRYGKEYFIDTRTYDSQVNASYTHDYSRNTGVFKLPRIKERGRIYYRTALDQGIVSHEGGHLVLYRLVPLGHTSHENAFHEAFADLTAHFYRFDNKATRRDFLQKLKGKKGCVGDVDFTCVRDNHHVLTLSDVSQNKALCEEHDLSRVFSNAVYSNMVTAYGRDKTDPENIVTWHRRTLVQAVLSCRKDYHAPTLMDMAYKMLDVSYRDPQYRESLGRHFIKNQLIVILYRPITSYYTPNAEFLDLCQ